MTKKNDTSENQSQNVTRSFMSNEKTVKKKTTNPPLSKGAVSCPVPSDVLDLLKYIANSDERLYRERARALLRRYCS